MRARAGRVGRLPGSRRRGSCRGSEGCRHGADGQRWPELHRGQALHRRPIDPRTVRESDDRRDATLRNGRSAQGGHETRTDAEHRGPRRNSPPGRRKHPQGRAPAAWRQDPGSPRRLVPSDGSNQRPARAARA